MINVAPLRLPAFRRLLATRLLSQLADGVFQAALAAYVVFSPERQPTPGAIASAFAVMLLPFSLVGPFTGVLLDRWRRRQVLLYGNLLRLLLCLATAAVLAGAPPAVYLGAALLVTGVNRFVLAGLSAALPQVVPEEQLVAANSMAPTLGTLAAALGGSAAVAVHLVLPPGSGADATLLAGAALGYGCSSLAVTTLGRDALGPVAVTEGTATAEGTAAAEGQPADPPASLGVLLSADAAALLAGVRHLLRECRPAAFALGAVTATRFCYGLLLVCLLMLCRNTFADPGDQSAGLSLLGLAVGASALGFFAAALLTPAGARRFGADGWLLGNLLAALVLTPALCLFFSYGPMLLGAALIGMVSQAVKISTDTLVQSTVGDAYRGRVFAVYDVLFNAALVAAAAAAALLLPASGRSAPLILFATLLYGATAVVYGSATAGRRRNGRPAGDQEAVSPGSPTSA